MEEDINICLNYLYRKTVFSHPARLFSIEVTRSWTKGTPVRLECNGFDTSMNQAITEVMQARESGSDIKRTAVRQRCTCPKDLFKQRWCEIFEVQELFGLNDWPRQKRQHGARQCCLNLKDRIVQSIKAVGLLVWKTMSTDSNDK